MPKKLFFCCKEIDEKNSNAKPHTSKQTRAGSSAVEHPTFNRVVVGSIPTRPTIHPILIIELIAKPDLGHLGSDPNLKFSDIFIYKSMSRDPIIRSILANKYEWYQALAFILNLM